MSDTSTSTGAASPSATSSPGSSGRSSGGGQVSPLQSGQGTTSIADSVVSKIAALAAREIPGVNDLGGGGGGAIGGLTSRIRGPEHRTTGVSVEVGERQAAIDITIKAEYPQPIHQIADEVRRNVIGRIESMTGLDVVEVNIEVADLAFPEQEAQRQADRDQQQRQQEQTTSEPRVR